MDRFRSIFGCNTKHFLDAFSFQRENNIMLFENWKRAANAYPDM